MMNTKQRLHTNSTHGLKTAITLFLFLLSACSVQETSAIDEGEKEGLKLSDQELRIEIDGWKPLEESRANLYEDESDLKDENLGGKNFTLYGYIDTDNGYHTYLGGAHAYWYEFGDKKEWVFRSGDNEITYYWPQNDAVNFFAYMPYKGYDVNAEGNMKHYVTYNGYTKGSGPTFDCNLPTTNANDANQVEFIYAYVSEKTKPAVGEPLSLKFQHPFATVSFQLGGGSYRMKVQEITLGNIHTTGTFSVKDQSWTPKTTGKGTSSYQASFGQEGILIPSDAMNYNTDFGGPYLVMPQDLTNVTLRFVGVRGDEVETIDQTVSLARLLNLNNKEHTQWLPGKQYTYRILIGNNKEEIYFDVVVEDEGNLDWIEIEDKTEISVE